MVVGRTAGGVVVKTGDTTIEVTDYAFEGKLRIGDRLA
jgi:hypothetical protein